MFDLEKLQNNSQENAEKFAHLVTFNNTYGLNGKDIRMSFPQKYNRMVLFGTNFQIVFNEDNLTLIFKYKPTESSVNYISELSNEVKYNNKFFNRFKKSDENIRLQFLPKSSTDGSLVEWTNVKLMKISNQFIQTEESTNILETKLIFSFRKLKHKYLSHVNDIIEKKVENTKKVIEKYMAENKQNKDELWKELSLPNAPIGSDITKHGYKFKKNPGLDNWPTIVKEEEVKEEDKVVNCSEKNEKTDEKVCKADGAEKSEHESTKEKPNKYKKTTKKGKK